MRYANAIGFLGIMAWCAGMILPGTVFAAGKASGYTLEDLKLNSAEDLVDVCTIDAGHNDYSAALAFCYGFFEGAIHYDELISSTPTHVDLVCSPPGTTRSEAVQVFVTYMQANNQYNDNMPVDAIFRALVDKWPCEK